MPCPIPSFELEDADSEGDNLLTTTHTEED